MKNLAVLLIAIFGVVNSVQAQYGPQGTPISGMTGNQSGQAKVALNANGTIMAFSNSLAVDQTGNENGMVQVHQWNGTSWTQMGGDLSFPGVGTSTGWHFGYSLDLNDAGDRLVVGAPYYQGNAGFQIGGVVVYDWNGSAWVQIQVINYWATNDHYRFGNTVSISGNGDRIAIHSQLDNGVVEVHEWNGSSYGLLDAFTQVDLPGGSQNAAIKMSADGNRVALTIPGWGAIGLSLAGAARVYEWNGSNYGVMGTLIEGTVPQGRIGFSVDLNETGDRLLVSASKTQASSVANDGGFHIFDWSGTTWVETSVVSGVQGAQENLGSHLSISNDGNTVVCRGSETCGSSNAFTEVYEWNGANWNVTGARLRSGGGIVGNVSLSANGNTIAMADAFTLPAGEYSAWQYCGSGPAPEIDVSGAGNYLGVCDEATAANSTDFGSTSANSPITNQFVIENNGSQSLTISSVTLGGDDPAAFSITQQPSSTVAPGSSTTVEVTFNADQGLGDYNAELLIANNDCDENVFSFPISGEEELTFTPGSLCNTDSPVSINANNNCGAITNATGPGVSFQLLSGTSQTEYCMYDAGAPSNCDWASQLHPAAAGMDIMFTGTHSSTFSSSGATEIEVTIYGVSCSFVNPNVDYKINGVTVANLVPVSTQCNPVVTGNEWYHTVTLTGAQLSGLTGTNDVLSLDITNFRFFSGVSFTVTEQAGEYIFDPAAVGAGTHDVTLTGCGGTTLTSVMVDACSGVNTWTGAISTDWNNIANWSDNIIPTSATNAVIANVANDPIISANVSAADVEVQSGALLRVANGGSLTLEGALNNSGTITIQSGGSFLQGASSSISTIGTFNVQRQGSSGQVYNYWSTPMQSWSGIPGAGTYLFNSNTSTESFADDQDPDPGWISYNGAMTPGKGYAGSGAGLATFTGTPNNGNVDFPLTYHPASPGNTAPGTPSNLCGNPYPSAISCLDLVNLNTDIDGAIYFWDDDNSSGNDYTSTDYAVWNGTGSLGTGAGAAPPNGFIGSCQGFMVRAASLGAVLNFNNGMRATSNSQFFRLATGEDSRIWMSLSNETLYNQMLFGVIAHASDARDRVYDAEKIRGNNEIALATMIGTDEFCIQAIGSSEMDRIIPLVTKVATAGTYTFTVDSLEGFTDYTILLIDNETGLSYSLAQGEEHTFTISPTDEYGRFQLGVNYNGFTGVEEDLEEDHRVSVFDHQLNIQIDESASATINMYNMLGKLVWSEYTKLAEGNNQVALPNVASGQYLITLQSENFSTSIRSILN